MSKYKEIYWFTFEDFSAISKQTSVPSKPYFSFASIKETASAIGAISLDEIKTDFDVDANIEITNQLWNDLFARYCKHYIIKTDHETLNKDDCRGFFIKFLNILARTGDYYGTVLNVYKAQKDNLMNQIKSSSMTETKFNDTPETIQGSDDYTGNDYMTNYTAYSGTSTTDGMSPIQRLKEIQDHYKQTMRDWINEFDGLFLEERNISNLED